MTTLFSEEIALVAICARTHGKRDRRRGDDDEVTQSVANDVSFGFATGNFAVQL